MKFVVLTFLLRFNIVFGLVGGENVSILQAPFQANYADICGSVIIHVRWTLTTAHCGTEGTFIRVGSASRLTGIKIQIQRHIVHPKYIGQGQFDYDIQLLRLFKELRFGRHLRSVGICDRLESPDCGGELKVFGWGYGREKGDYNSQLQMIQVQRVPIEDCQEIPKLLNNEIELTSRMFCAKGDGQDACQGDSGGAAISSASGLLLGLSSFGYGCGRDLPGVYISVSPSTAGDIQDPGYDIRAWIKHHSGI